jgi:hypothetical protein
MNSLRSCLLFRIVCFCAGFLSQAQNGHNHHNIIPCFQQFFILYSQKTTEFFPDFSLTAADIFS